MGDIYKSSDLFGSSVHFTVNNGSVFKSFLGATLSLMIIAVVLIYGQGKWVKMINRADTTFQQSTADIRLNNTLGELEFDFYIAVSDMYGDMPSDISGYLELDITNVRRFPAYAELAADLETKEFAYHKCGGNDMRDALESRDVAETKYMH